ncbi:acyl carrier protein [Nonomuraea sp. SYSU D8015]|uniref:acyl carrier protein n=1 Tax=Nonomuraea sp. SYSU D8015 TaxID=2593644 RepID=UPI0016611466|nr:acyl carrier protein [Nonomuraea sp. SYSU D8015]
MKEFTFDDLKRVVSSCLGTAEAAELTLETADVSFDELGLDSLARYEVAMVLQEQLGLPIPDEDIDRMLSPRAALDYVNERLATAAS